MHEKCAAAIRLRRGAGGVGADTTQQAIQLRMRAVGQNLVGSAGARLVVRDAAGLNPITLIVFTSNPPSGVLGGRILVASPEFDVLQGTAADFLMTNTIPLPTFRLGASPSRTAAGRSCGRSRGVERAMWDPILARPPTTPTGISGNVATASTTVGPIQFHTVTPCRVADTREPPGPSGGPPLFGGGFREFPVSLGTGGTLVVLFAIDPATPWGATTHVLLDVNGYFRQGRQRLSAPSSAHAPR
jgi:hypothetical protein